MPQPGGPSDSGGRSGGRAPRPNHEAPSSRGGLRVESIRAGHHKVSCWTLRARGLTAKSAEFALARCEAYSGPGEDKEDNKGERW